MGLTAYTGILSNGQGISLNLYRGDRNDIMPLSPEESYLFTNADTAEYALSGLFNRQTTYFVHFNVAKTFFGNLGFSSIVDCPCVLYLPKGRIIQFKWGYGDYGGSNSSYYDMDVVYVLRGKTITLSYSEARDYGSGQTRSQYGFPSAIGLMTEKAYEYVAYHSGGGVHAVRTIASPVCSYRTYQPSGVFLPGNYINFNQYTNNAWKNGIGPNNVSKSCLSIPRRIQSSGFLITPALTSGYFMQQTSSEWVDTTDNFETALDFFTEFWSEIDTQYLATVTQSVGGSVSPNGFFASPNEPRMFTVTPDSHHAIFSVAAYNVANGVQIPLQESGVDLQTGSKSYIFTMPAANVSIVVEFRSIEISIPVTVKYVSEQGRTYTTSFNLLYDNARNAE